MTQRRPTRAKIVTTCTTCMATVGVTWNRFNDAVPIPKTLHHKTPSGQACPGGRKSVHPNVIMEAS